MPRLQKLDPEKLTTCHNKKLSYAKLRYFYEVDKNNTLQVVTALERWMKAIIVKMSTSTVLTDEFHGHLIIPKRNWGYGVKGAWCWIWMAASSERPPRKRSDESRNLIRFCGGICKCQVAIGHKFLVKSQKQHSRLHKIAEKYCETVKNLTWSSDLHALFCPKSYWKGEV